MCCKSLFTLGNNLIQLCDSLLGLLPLISQFIVAFLLFPALLQGVFPVRLYPLKLIDFAGQPALSGQHIPALAFRE